MKTREFLNLLSTHADKELLFEYVADKYVPKAYHITEVKNVTIGSVDCGGNEHDEKQTIVQLWNNPVEFKQHYMHSDKALKIMEKVDSLRPLDLDTEIFFEYGDRTLPTSNYSVKKAEVIDDKVVMKMYVEPTACKPSLLNKVGALAEAACCGTAESKCC